MNDTRRRRPGVLSKAVMIVAGVMLLCGAASVVAAPNAAADDRPAIWVGSPIGVKGDPANGTWGVPGDASTIPPDHHKLVKAEPQNDWSVDLSNIPANDRAVHVYAAASDTSYNNALTATITQIIDDNACRNGGGGDLVTVSFWLNGALYGNATYAHLDRDPSLYVGKSVPRWGAYLGNVSFLDGDATGGPDCWTGPHVHLELRAESHYSCWNRGYTLGYDIGRTNFVGFVSGPLDPSAATPCP